MSSSPGKSLPYSFPHKGKAPWSSAEHSYASWVPNVSGHLSFGVIDGHGKCHTVNQHCDAAGTRVLVVHQRRSAQDFPLPGGMVGLLRKSATQDYLIVANTSRAWTPNLQDLPECERLGTGPRAREEDNGVMVGEVIVIPPDTDPETAGTLKKALAHIHETMDLRQQECLEGDLDALTALPSEVLATHQAAARTIACFRLNFALFRTGEVRIWFDLDHFLGRDSAAFPPTELEEVAADALPSQVYYFLKDVVHFHYHHDRRSDQLLDITRIGPAASEAEQDARWRTNILRGLAKVVVEYRQSNRTDSNKKALGVLAYADAFQSVLARIRRKGPLEHKFEWNPDIILYDFEHTKSSIEALDALSEARRGAHLQLFGIFVGVLLSALALWAGAVQIQPILCGDQRANAAVCPPIKPDFTTDLVNQVVANPLGFVVFLALLGAVAYIFLFKRVTDVPLAKPILRFFRSLSIAVGADVARRRGDRAGYYAQLAVLGGLAGFTAWAAYKVTPKNEVAPVLPRPAAVQRGPWSSLDNLVGKPPRDTGLFSASVVSGRIRDILGKDYEDFLGRMARQSDLKRNGDLLWVVGTRGAEDPDGAYLLINQAAQRIEVGIWTNGKASIYRDTGSPLRKPPEVQRAMGGFAGDISPFPVETSSCKSIAGGDGGSAIQLSGAMAASENCEFRFDLRKGQVISFHPGSARGLDVAIAQQGHAEPIGDATVIGHDGTYVIRVNWQQVGERRPVGGPRRAFYVRLNVR